MVEQEIIFEEAQVSDAAALIAFMNQVAIETDFLDIDDQGFQPTLEQTQAILARSQEEPNQLCLLAKSGGRIVGLINVRT